MVGKESLVMSLDFKKIWPIMVLQFTLFGCASVPKQELIRLQWPEPPLATRIEFVQTLASEEDLGRARSRGDVFLELLTGRRPPRWHLFQPIDVAVSDNGKRVYVSDYGQLQVFVFDLENREVRFLGPFDRPFGLDVDGDENLYLAEQGSATIHVLDKQGKKLKAIRHPELIRSADIVIDRQRSKLYAADPSSKKAEQHTVKVFDLDGNLMGQIGRGKGEAPGQLYFPTYLALDRWGNLYVSNTMNARVDVFSPDGEHLKSIGERGNAFGMFDKPKGIALDQFDNIYVVDSNWGNVQIFNQKGQVLLYFGGRGSYSGLLKNPTGIDIDRNNRIYVADLLNDRVSVYQLINTTAGDSLSPLPSAQRVSPGAFQSEDSTSMPVPGFSQSQEMLKGGESR